MPTKAAKSIARRGRLIVKSMFSGYDLCMNPYVGCEFGCSYCYVRFMIKDEDHDWGEFVRIRQHMADKLPKELAEGYFRIENGSEQVADETGVMKKRTIFKTLPTSEARLVIGTMTDPYQPVEKRHRITRTALEVITQHPHQFKKVGIFTRSPLVIQDIDLIKKLPNARVHYTVTPFPPEVLRAIEPYCPITKRRWDTVKALKAAGLRVHVNVSPIIPLISDGYEQEFVEKLIELQVDEYFVDPMQAYKDSWDALKRSAMDLKSIDFQAIELIVKNKDQYLDWKFDFMQRWNKFREPIQHKAPNQLPIWSDHENKVWINMLTGEQMSKRVYGDERTSETRDNATH